MPHRRKQIGRFTLPIILLQDDPERYLPIFAHLVVVHAEYRYGFNEVEYTAWSPLFDEVEFPTGQFCEAPTYEWTLSNHNGRVYHASPKRVL